MSKVIKINCSHASYVDKYHPSSNYSESDSLITGIVSSRMLGFNLYKTILNFNISDINPSKVKGAHLFIFVENMKYANTFPGNIGICGNYDDVNTTSVVWNDFPQKNFTEILYLNIPRNSSGSYIKIDVLPIIQELLKTKSKYNLIFTPIDSDSSVIVKFGSVSSNNPPYLKLSLEESDSMENTIKNDNIKTQSSSDTKKDILIRKNAQDNKELKKNKINRITNNSRSDSPAPAKETDMEEKTIAEHDNKSKHNEYIDNVQSQISFRHNQNQEIKVQNLLNEILSNMAEQSQIITSIKSYNEENKNNPPYKNELVNITNKLDSYNDELISIKNDLSEKASSEDIHTSDNILSEVLSKLSSQSDLIESVRNITSSASTIKDIEITNDNISSLSENLNSLGAILNSFKESLENSATSQDIDSINTIILTLINSLDIQSSDLAIIKDSIEKACSRDDLNAAINSIKEITSNSSIDENIITINTTITSLSSALTNESSKLDYIKNKIEANPTISDIDALKEVISSISSNINSQNENLLSIKEITSNISTSDEIISLNELISSLSNSITAQNEQLSILKEKVIQCASYDDIAKSYDLLSNLNTAVNSQTNNLNSISDLLALIKIAVNSQIDNIDNVTKNISTLPSKDDIISIKDYILILSQSITAQDSVLSLIKDEADNDENFNNIQKLLNNLASCLSEESKTLSRILDSNSTINNNDTTMLNVINTIASESENNSSLITEILDTLTKPDINILELKDSVHKLIDDSHSDSSMLKAIKEITDNSLTSDDINETNIIISNLNNEIKSKLEHQHELLESINEFAVKAITPENISSLQSSIKNNFQELVAKLSQSISIQESSFSDIKDALNKDEDFEKINNLLNDVTTSISDENKILSQILGLNNSSYDNYQSLNERIEKIESSLYPLNVNMNTLIAEMSEIKDSISKIDLQSINNNTNPNGSDIDSINDKLASLSTKLEKVMNLISSITIEPLN